MGKTIGVNIDASQLISGGALRFKDVIDCSGNPNYPAGQSGDVYKVSVAGKIGGSSGAVVQAGDEIYCTADAAAGTQAQVGTSWAIIQGNIVSTADVPDSTDKRYVTDAELAVLANTSGTNTGDQTVPVKATGAELNTGTDDDKFATAKALADSDYAKTSDIPSITGKMATDGANAALPTADPLAAGALWNDSGTVKVSAGPPP